MKLKKQLDENLGERISMLDKDIPIDELKALIPVKKRKNATKKNEKQNKK